MPGQNLSTLTATVQRLLRRGADTNAAKILERRHAAEIAAVLRELPELDRLHAFRLIASRSQRGEVLSEVTPEVRVALMKALSDDEIVAALQGMSSDDAAYVLGELEPERATSLLKRLKPEQQVETLMDYAPGTAGRIMVPSFFDVFEDTTVSEAIATLQRAHEKLEMVFYLYIVNSQRQLVGVVSLRQLVTSKPDTRLGDIMTTDVVRVHTHTDQEEVARQVARYNILAIPVVDEQNVLVGIVTVDDIIDVIREEATEDFLKMAGVGEDLLESASVPRATRTRLPWLFASWMSGIAASGLIAHFSDALSSTLALAAFMPVILGMSGNVGTQSATIVVRGIATGRIDLSELGKVLAKETTIGLLLGVIYGLLLGIYAGVFYREVPHLWLVVGVSIATAMVVAAFAGTFIPLAFERMNVDPAVATGPFVTSSLDILGTLVYFNVARVVLQV